MKTLTDKHMHKAFAAPKGGRGEERPFPLLMEGSSLPQTLRSHAQAGEGDGADPSRPRARSVCSCPQDALLSCSSLSSLCTGGCPPARIQATSHVLTHLQAVFQSSSRGRACSRMRPEASVGFYLDCSDSIYRMCLCVGVGMCGFVLACVDLGFFS